MDTKNNKQSDKSSPPGEAKKVRKTPERHPYKYDPLIHEIRKISPCNRSSFKAVAVDQFVDSYRNEQGDLSKESIEQIASIVASKRERIESKEIKGLSL